MGIFTRDEEELHVYDADAFFYFAGAMLLVTLIPWTYVLQRRLRYPRPPEEADFDARGNNAPKGATVKRCTTAAMEGRRQHSLKIAHSWSRRLRSGGNGCQLVALCALWCCFVGVAIRLSVTPSELSVFDPYDILGVDRGASMPQIKKAYRTKSLHHHPDKDRENPLAPALFQQISKAYAALTDDGARRNYEKYGNPDGPAQMKVGIALHPAIVSSRSSRLTFLCCFFASIISVPLAVVCCCLRGTSLSASGVSGETLRIYHAVIDPEVRAEDGPGLLAASTEARMCGLMAGAAGGGDMKALVEAMAVARPEPLVEGALVNIKGGSSASDLKGRKGVLRKKASELCWAVEVFPPHGPPTGPDQTSMRELPASELVSAEPRAPCPFNDPPIRRGAAILWSHLWRLHRQMDRVLQFELEQMLVRSTPILRATVSIAAHGRGDRSTFIGALRGLIGFQRSLVQALDLDADPLLQVPHVTKLPPASSKTPLPTLREVISGEGGADKALAERLKLTPEQRLDVEAFCRHVPRMELSCKVEVDDESDVAEGDMATLVATMTRANLNEGEAAGPVHAPLFPVPKFEEWWLLVFDERSRRFVTADLVQGTGRKEEYKIRFIVPRAGNFRWTVHAMCDSYLGLDVQSEVTFKALRRSQVNKEIFVHPDDANIKTLFEELMEGLQVPDEDSESEEEEWPTNRTAKPKAVAAPAPTAVVAADQAPASEAAKQAEKDSDSESSDSEPEPEGVFHRISAATGAAIYKQPVEEDEDEQALQLGSIPSGAVIRGYVDEERPSGWLELAPRGSAWIRVGEGKTEDLGGLLEQKLGAVVQTPTPVMLVKRWMKQSKHEVSLEDVLMLREIENDRVRMLVEELARERMGEEKFERLLDEVADRDQQRRKRLSKAVGRFQTQNGCLWHVLPNGRVRGLHPDGSRIRDKVEVADGGKGVDIGPFRLDETRSCSCIHWMRKDDPSGQKSWVWQQDLSLDSRVKIGSAF